MQTPDAQPHTQWMPNERSRGRKPQPWAWSRSLASRVDSSCSSFTERLAVPTFSWSNCPATSRPCSSATCWISESTWSTGVCSVVAADMEFSSTCDRTSRSSNCFSNWSIVFDIFSRSIDCIALPKPFTKLPMSFVTCFMVMAVWIRWATASRRDDMHKKLLDSFFFRIAFSAYIRAPSVLPCCMAFLILSCCPFCSFSAFCAMRSICFAENFMLKSCFCSSSVELPPNRAFIFAVFAVRRTWTILQKAC
eukprot:Opistho-2@20830